MSEFKPIETQEQLEEVLKDRLSRAEKKYSEQYSGYLSPDDVTEKTKELEEKIAELSNSLNGANEKATKDSQTIADLEAKIKAHETASVKSRIAHEVGIPYELANKLSGETEEDIRKDAEALKPFVTPKTVAPLRNPEAGDPGMSTREKFAEWAKAQTT